MKKILLIATGGTIASRYTPEGLSPSIAGEEMLSYCPDFTTFCTVDSIQPFCLDSTNIEPDHWLIMARAIEDNYDKYDGFVIAHGTDTMAYSAAALSYLIQSSPKPIVITGSQKPMGFPSSDAISNLTDSLRFASHDRAHGVSIVFGGKVICGTRAKKEYSHSYNAFSSINYPVIATVNDARITFFIDDKADISVPVFYHNVNKSVVLLKLIPGVSGAMIRALIPHCDAVIIESFGVGGIPEYEGFKAGVRDFVAAGKLVIMATQVTNEGSDMSIYQVGKAIKEELALPESYDMTLEATVAKTMWALANSEGPEDFKKLFYTPVNHDLMWVPV